MNDDVLSTTCVLPRVIIKAGCLLYMANVKEPKFVACKAKTHDTCMCTIEQNKDKSQLLSGNTEKHVDCATKLLSRQGYTTPVNPHFQNGNNVHLVKVHREIMLH